MPLVFKDMASGINAPSRFSEWFGYQFRIVGSDLIVDDTDPALAAGPPDVLRARATAWNATKDKIGDVCDEFVRDFLNTEFDEKGPKPPRLPIEVDSQYGTKTELEHVKLRFFFSNAVGLRKVFKEDIYPFFCEKLQLTNITPITLSALEYQRRLSLIKIPLLVREFGVEQAQVALTRARALDSVMPTSMEAMNYVDALLTFGASSFALPLHRMGCSLYFRGGGFCGFSLLGLEDNYEQLMMKPGALVESGIARFLKRSPGNRAYEGMVSMAVLATNKLLRFLNDPKEHVSKNAWDPKGQLQTHANFRMIMADVQATTFSASAYVRQRFALSALDRIANVWKAFGSRNEDEATLFRALLSKDTAELVTAVLRANFEAVSRTAARAFSQSAASAHKRIHEVVGRQLGQGADEGARLEAIRILRNANHGTFLTRGQFERAFLQRSLSLPTEVEVYVYFLVWALCFDATKFLTRKP